MSEWWRTNRFRVLDIERFDSNGLFSSVCDVTKDDDGSVTLSATDSECFLIVGDLLSPLPRKEIEECGGNPDKIVERTGTAPPSYDPDSEEWSDVWGFEVLDTCLQPNEVVICIMTRPGYGAGFAWREGMREGDVLSVTTRDIFSLAEKEFGKPQEEFFGFSE